MDIKPPPFEFNASEWWVKPLAMLQHNWAVIDGISDSVAVYFFMMAVQPKTHRALYSEVKMPKDISLSWTP